MIPTDARTSWALQLQLSRAFLIRDGPVQLVILLRLPVLHVIFAVVQNLSSLCTVGVRSLCFTRNDGTVVEEFQKAAAVAGEDDLLLGSLNGSEELSIVSFLQLLTGLRLDVSLRIPC